MMELVKKNIHMNRWKGNVTSQITLDDDFIVPDTMDDMEQVVLDTGDIVIESVKNMGEKAVVKGKLDFNVLYRKPGGGLQTMGGSLPFEETINVQGLEEKDYIQLDWELDDINAGIINSRKLNIKAIITLDVRVESLYDVEAAVEVDLVPSSEGKSFLDGNTDSTGDKIETLKREVDAAVIAARRKDTYRIKDSMQVSGNKPNIEKILWSEIKLRGVNSRPADGKILIDGTLMVFIIYSGEGEDSPIQWMEESIPFAGELELTEASEDMVPSICVHLIHKEVEAKPDYDGELRELEVDAVLELDMKLYQEETVELLSDIYSTNQELTLQTEEACFDQIQTKNMSKCKVSEKIKMGDSERILQICHCEGNVKIDETEVKNDELHVEGVLEVQLLYLTSDDLEPVKSSVEAIPFQYVIEAQGLNQESHFQLVPGIEQMNAVMTGGDSIEVKAVITLDLLVLQPVCQQIITGAASAPMDMQRVQKMPGIVGYIVQPGDTLWEIAKKFHTTIDTIMAANSLTDSLIHPGDRLILVKELS